jgi:CRP-like cAMP-binding protein
MILEIRTESEARLPGSPKAGRKRRTRGQATGENRFPAGTKIFSEELPCSRMYLLRKGRVQISIGKQAILDYLSARDFFGEQVFLRPERRRQTAQTVAPVSVSAFRIADLLDRIQKDRRFARRLITNLVVRLEARGEVIRDFVTEAAEQRLARLFLRLIPARNGSGWVRLRFNPSNAEMARTIGTTRARIAYFTGRFRRLGWLERRPELWVNREGLLEFLQLDARVATHRNK